jgi:DNA-binding transcriptional MerR regulator
MTVTQPETADNTETADMADQTDQCASRNAVHPRPEGQDRYTISEVASCTGLSAHTLRWYERIGLMPHVDRSHTGHRRFTNKDLDWLSLVGKLRLTGMPVADMVRYAELVRAGEHTVGERHALLEATRRDVRHRIAELHDTLAVLDYKIDMYAAKALTGGAAPHSGKAAQQ